MYAVWGVEPKANYSQFFSKILALSFFGTGNQVLYFKTKFCAPKTLENNMSFEFFYFMILKSDVSPQLWRCIGALVLTHIIVGIITYSTSTITRLHMTKKFRLFNLHFTNYTV